MNASKTTCLALLALALGLGIPGCASPSKTSRPRPPSEHETYAKQFNPPPPGWGGLYVFRGPGTNYGEPWMCWVDGRCAGEIGGEEFLYRMVRPGRHVIRNRTGEPYSFEVKKGENVYLKGVLKPNSSELGVFSGFRRVYPEAGEEAIASRHLATDRDLRGYDLVGAESMEGGGTVPARYGPEWTPPALPGNGP